MSKTDAENMLKGGFKNGLLECGKEPCNCFLSCCLAPYAIGKNYFHHFEYKLYGITNQNISKLLQTILYLIKQKLPRLLVRNQALHGL